VKEVKTMFTNGFSKESLILCVVMVLGLLIPAFVSAAISVDTLLVLDGEAAGDQFGTCISTSGDFNGDGYKDFVAAAALNAAGGNRAGRAYMYLGGPVLDATPDLVITGSAVELLGVAAAAVGDVNNDGFDDFVVGARGNAGGPSGTWTPGSAYLFFGGPTVDAVPDLVFSGEHPGDSYGCSLAGLGDINADGHDDFVITAPWWPNKGYRGKAYVYFGGPGLDNVADMTFSISEGELGVGVCPGGDFTGDGYNDLLIGAYKKDMPAFDSGAAWLYIGGPALDAVADFAFGGENRIDWFGSSMDWVGDLNDDGYNDLAIGASKYPNAGDRGRAYIFFGGPSLDTTPDLVITGEAAGDYCRTVAGVGDVNYDGIADLMVGASGNDEAGTDAGKVYLFLGGPGLDAVPDFEMTGGTVGERFGLSVRGLGDINGDCRPDFAVGAPYRNGQTGRVYVFSVPAGITFDIKPGSCPNPFNIKDEIDEGGNGKEQEEDYAIDRKTGGVVPAAIVGSEEADVSDIDVSTILLEGIPPLRSNYEDVTRPVENGGECACTDQGPDGYLDLTLKFSRNEISEVLGPLEHGEVVELTITGALMDGTPFEASDCITIVGKRPEGPRIEAIDVAPLGNPVPNPFNPITRIHYYVPDESVVTLEIFDTSGRLVVRLVDNERMRRGMHAVEWRGVDGHGRAVGSGVYYYRLKIGAETISKKMVLLR
jgi:hypothetical protein